MKLRIEFNNQKHWLTVRNEVQTLDELKNLISSQIADLPPKYSLSLNGRSALECGEGNESIQDAGIVSGDLVYILCGINAPNGDGGSLYGINAPNGDGSSSDSKPHPIKSVKTEATASIWNKPTKPGNFQIKTDKGEINTTGGRMCDELSDVLMRKSMDVMMKKLKKLHSSPQKIITIIIHYLMSELGFKLVDEVEDGKLEMNDESNDEKNDEDDTTTMMTFQYFNFTDMTYELLLVTMLNKSILQGFARKDNEVLIKESFQFDPCQYIKESEGHEELMENVFRRDRVILMRKSLRDGITNKLRQFALKVYGFPEIPELSTLLYDVQLEILNLLDVRSLLNLSQTCSLWLNLSTSPLVWKRKYQQLRREANQTGKTSWDVTALAGERKSCHLTEEANWFEMYKLCYKLERDRNRHVISHFYTPTSLFPLYDIPPSRVIGGDYDLYPGIIRDPLHGPSGLIEPPRRLRVTNPRFEDTFPDCYVPRSSNRFGNFQGPNFRNWP